MALLYFALYFSTRAAAYISSMLRPRLHIIKGELAAELSGRPGRCIFEIITKESCAAVAIMRCLLLRGDKHMLKYTAVRWKYFGDPALASVFVI